MFLGRGSGKMSFQLGHVGLRGWGHPPGELRLGLCTKARVRGAEDSFPPQLLSRAALGARNSEVSTVFLKRASRACVWGQV